MLVQQLGDDRHYDSDPQCQKGTGALQDCLPLADKNSGQNSRRPELPHIPFCKSFHGSSEIGLLHNARQVARRHLDCQKVLQHTHRLLPALSPFIRTHRFPTKP